MPTSTTVSMVFELLGATFVVSLIKMASDTTELGFNDLLNTEKALSVIIGIFLSVAIAFFFGTLVQFITRMLFSFNFRSKLKWKIGVFGGICATAIVYFLLIKGAKDLNFMTPEVKAWINDNTPATVGGCFVGFTLLMQMLHFLKVNVLKVIVLMGTFALAMAFAGNDLVNFIGIPLSGLASFQDYSANGLGDPDSFMMSSLNSPADTPLWFLVGAGIIMVVALASSKKAQKVAQTEIGLGSQNGGDEMFGSSKIARSLVRWTLALIARVRRATPKKLRRFFSRRFNVEDSILEDGAAFDLLRGAVNLVLAGALIALGTSLKLPLSTTFVTFMVAMGTSLSDRAWGRESAVFRITGVISVIGGWFLTAGAAFIGAGAIVFLMHLGGLWIMMALAVTTIFIIIRSNRRFRAKSKAEQGDTLFQTILATQDSASIWPMFLTYLTDEHEKFLSYAKDTYGSISNAFLKEDVRTLAKTEKSLPLKKRELKSARRRETLCLRKLNRETAIEKSTWFYLGNNCCMSMLYSLYRINEICKEHVDNNFLPLPASHEEDFNEVRRRVGELFDESLGIITTRDTAVVNVIRRRCDKTKDMISDIYHKLYDQIREGDSSAMTVLYVYLNMLQETQEIVSALRKFLRSFAKMCDKDYSGRR